MNKYFRMITAFLVFAVVVMACSFSVGGGNETSSDRVATIVASTLEALTPPAEGGAIPVPVNGDDILPYSLYYLGKDDAGHLQVFRVERDGVTRLQVTFEPGNVGSYDVSQVDGSVAYVSNNQLLLVNADGSGRRVLVDGGPIDTDKAYLNSINKPVFALDKTTIAYGYQGLNFYSLDTGATNRVIENKINTIGDNIRIAAELYIPEKYSPDGTKLLITLGYYEGASAAIYYPASDTLVRLNGGGGALICCGMEIWTNDSSAFYSANPVAGMFTPGLWKVDASTGIVTTLLASNYDMGLFNYASTPYLAPDGQLYYFFHTTDTEFMNHAPLQLVRSALDGVSGLEVLRTDTFGFMNEALWAPDASFVIVVLAPDQNVYYGGRAEVTYLDGRPSVILTPFAQDMKWGP